MSGRELVIVFDGPPGPEAGRFVEVEDGKGKGVDVGEWRDRGDGYWELVLTRADVEEYFEVQHLRVELERLRSQADESCEW